MTSSTCMAQNEGRLLTVLKVAPLYNSLCLMAMELEGLNWLSHFLMESHPNNRFQAVRSGFFRRDTYGVWDTSYLL